MSWLRSGGALETETRRFRHDAQARAAYAGSSGLEPAFSVLMNMTLNPFPSHPSSLCYVLKLHRDSLPAQGLISGLLEHAGTGHSIAFADANALVAALRSHAATEAAQAYRGSFGQAT